MSRTEQSRRNLHALKSLRDKERVNKQKSLHFEVISCAIARFVGDCFGEEFMLSRHFKPRNDARAFTLAEVLITLGIIGIVAAMTIPTLVTNYQKTRFVAELKKAYSQMNQVLLQMAVDAGTPDDISSYFGTTTVAGSAIAARYKTSKICGTTAGNECFERFDNDYDGKANSTSIWNAAVSPNYKFVTSDGKSFAIYSLNNSCKYNLGFSAAPDSPTYNSACATVYIDTNGKEKPNVYGKDVFTFYITNNKVPMLYPPGGFYHSDNNTGTISGGGNLYWNYGGTASRCSPSYKLGAFCSGRIISENWNITYY